MEVLARGKYIKISPKKARPVANLIRGKKASEARVVLTSLPVSAALEIKKVLDSAIANAQNNFNLDKEGLIVAKIVINGGPMIKRYMPRAKGMASEIKRRTSHIEIILSGEIVTKKKKVEKVLPRKVSSSDEDKKETKTVKSENPRDSFKKEVKKEQQKKSSPIFRRKTG